jgi:hypothetical protein
MGGSDDPDNLTYLSVKEHAIAHAELYKKYGKHEDYVAFKALKKHIDKEDLYKETSAMGGLNNTGKPKSIDHRNNIAKANKDNPKLKIPLTEDRKNKISKSMKGNSNSSNHSSPEYKKKQSEAMKKAWAKRKLK